MKFSSSLTDATLLKRTIKFLVEVVLPNGQKLMIRCPNLNPIIGCDILGTKVWYSAAIGYNCLPTWELVEVDGGNLVCINPELIKPLVVEGVRKGIIEEFLNYNVLHAGNSYEQLTQQTLLLENGNEKCYVALEQVTLGNERGDGFFPESCGAGNSNINKLVQICREGHKAILFFCVMHNGIKNVKPAYHIDPEYGRLLQYAIDEGVKLLAYKTAISLREIEFTTKLPILSAEGVIYPEH